MTESQRQFRADMIACLVQIAFGALLSVGIWSLAYAVMPDVLRPDGRHLTGDDFGIPAYASEVDADGDGLDDQTDILRSAKDYVATNPIYKSGYFQGGWPDDGTGVCTDVIAYALLGAGYDLREMVDEDIRTSQGDGSPYHVSEPDSNIDYRRVSNLRTFFDRHATTLTSDMGAVAEWQGGDIVCYPNHIGIVSDRRNEAGVPYVIHNGSSWQMRYEEDRLGDWGGPIRHWRWDGTAGT